MLFLDPVFLSDETFSARMRLEDSKIVYLFTGWETVLKNPLQRPTLAFATRRVIPIDVTYLFFI